MLLGKATIAGWERTSQKGSSYISLQASLPRERDGQGQTPRQQPQYRQPAAPAYRQQPMPEPAPMPSAEDYPAFGPDDDLPF